MSILVHPGPRGKQTAVADSATDRALRELRGLVDGRSFTDGAKVLTDLELTTSVQRIAHGLGRRPVGYLVVRTKTAAAAFVVADENDGKRDLALFLHLKTVGTAATVDLLVF